VAPVVKLTGRNLRKGRPETPHIKNSARKISACKNTSINEDEAQWSSMVLDFSGELRNNFFVLIPDITQWSGTSRVA
jgi:hypothetical protein